MLKKLTNEPQLTLVEAPALAPKEVEISDQQISLMQKELLDADKAPIDDADENI